MVALRSFCGPEGDADEHGLPVGRHDAADWLSLQQTACELGVSLSTVRRMIRRGKIRNRIVPRPGGFAYLLYVPNSRHARLGAHDHRDAPSDSTRSGLRLVDAEFERDVAANTGVRSGEVRRLQAQVRQLSRALARAVQGARPPAPALPHDAAPDPAAPYARYRALARKRRWWRF
ncbi:MAG: helix-turn-helix domain-containing protein [Chloroflexi bacterium]|nr:helix-turn-helix domain-containing protein [Chloroflexota bacterium]